MFLSGVNPVLGSMLRRMFCGFMRVFLVGAVSPDSCDRILTGFWLNSDRFGVFCAYCFMSLCWLCLVSVCVLCCFFFNAGKV